MNTGFCSPHLPLLHPPCNKVLLPGPPFKLSKGSKLNQMELESSNTGNHDPAILNQMEAPVQISKGTSKMMSQVPPLLCGPLRISRVDVLASKPASEAPLVPRGVGRLCVRSLSRCLPGDRFWVHSTCCLASRRCESVRSESVSQIEG